MDANSSRIALEMATACSFVLFAGGFWAISSLGQWAIAPVERAVARPRGALRFSLRELLLLILQMQLAMGICLWLAENRRWAISAMVLSTLGLAAMGWLGWRRLDSCRVTCPRRRAMFLGLVTPLTCLAIALGLWSNGRAVFEICWTGEFVLAAWLTGNGVSMLAFVVCRHVTLWVLSDQRAVSITEGSASVAAAK